MREGERVERPAVAGRGKRSLSTPPLEEGGRERGNREEGERVLQRERGNCSLDHKGACPVVVLHVVASLPPQGIHARPLA